MTAPSDRDREGIVSQGEQVLQASGAAEPKHLKRLQQVQSADSNLSLEEGISRLRALTAQRRQTPSEVILRESRDER